jgi:hypothetical protein
MESASPAKDGRLARRAEPLQQRREAVREPVQALHAGAVAGQRGEPVPPIAPGMPVDSRDLPLLFQGDREQVNSHDLLVGKV